MFKVTTKNNKFILVSIYEIAEFNVFIIFSKAYEVESSNRELKGNILDEGYIIEKEYPFSITPKFSTLGSIVKITPRRRWKNKFVQDDTSRELLGFQTLVIHEEVNLSHNPVEMMSFDEIFLETEFAQGRLSKKNDLK